MTTLQKEAPITPTRELQSVRNRIRRFLEEPFGLEFGLMPQMERRLATPYWSPAVEASELQNEFVITAELPGISAENVEISMDAGALTLRGSKQEERTKENEDRTYHLGEREYGKFERVFRFPVDVAEQKVTAEFANGILTIHVPKLEPQKAPPRTIPIAKK